MLEPNPNATDGAGLHLFQLVFNPAFNAPTIEVGGVTIPNPFHVPASWGPDMMNNVSLPTVWLRTLYGSARLVSFISCFALQLYYSSLILKLHLHLYLICICISST